MKKNKIKMWIFAIVALIVVAIIVFFIFSNKQTNNSATNNTATNNTTTKSNTASKNTNNIAASISYSDALVKYADRRIQLDPICQAHPNTVTYKDNTGIMIDNRSAQTRTIKIGTTFTLKPYGFKIVVLPDVYLKSKTILVDCDQSKNVATILIQE